MTDPASASSPQEDTQTPAPAIEPTAPPEEAPPAMEPETTEGMPVEAPKLETQTAQPQEQTAQMGRNEPIVENDEPLSNPISETQTATAEPVPQSLPSTPAPVAPAGRDVLAKARATIQDRKRKKLEKILEALNTKGKISNDEVEKLLHVSDATATRYLSTLEKEGKIKQVGKTGKSVVYTKV